ncbi:hypothetical protein V8E36_000286 [Tilletia maclaganii]
MSFAGKRKGGFSFGAGIGASSGSAQTSAAKGKQRAIDSKSSDGKGRSKGKRHDFEDDLDEDEDEEFDDGGDEDELEDLDDDLDDGAEDDVDEDAEADTDEEIEAAKAAVAKSSRTAKRKRRATSPGAFGATLQSLLGAGPEANDLQGDDADSAGTNDELDGDNEDETSLSPRPKKQRQSIHASTKTGRGAIGPPASLTTQTTGTFLASSRPSAILSLAPHLRRTLTSQKLNAKAARLAMQQRKMREERAHVTDVIGGWGPPGVLPTIDEAAWKDVLAKKKHGVSGVGRNLLGGSVNVDEGDEEQAAWLEEGGSRAYERKLRKVAQRGVVKLFNAIRAAQTTSLDDVKAAAGAPAAGASASDVKKAAMPGGKDAALTNLSKANFLDLIRSGTGTSATQS